MTRYLLALLLLSACTSPSRDQPAEPSVATTEGTPDADGPALDADDVARRVHRATNAARREQNLAALDWADRLAPLALGHSEDMARRGFFAHQNPDGESANDRAVRLDIECRRDLDERRYREGVAENLFQTWRWAGWREVTTIVGTTRTYDWQTASQIAKTTVQGWLDSPGHRRNLLDPDSQTEAVGVAVAPTGEVYVTQILC